MDCFATVSIEQIIPQKLAIELNLRWVGLEIPEAPEDLHGTIAQAQNSMGYQVTFDPPRRALDAPSAFDPDADPKGLWWRDWFNREHRESPDEPFSNWHGGRVFLGPEASTHPGHPFGNTNRPGPRLADALSRTALFSSLTQA